MPARAYGQLAVVATLALILTACPGGSPPESPRATATSEETRTQAPTATPEQTAAATPEATPAPTERAHEFSVEALYAHIPPDLVESCPEDEVMEGSNADFNTIVVLCQLPEGSGANTVRYALLEDPAQLEEAYLQAIEGYGVEEDQGECPGEIPSEASYSTEGAEDVGRFACAIIPNGGAHVSWTDERFAMLMEATRDDGDMATLHEWWAGPESGPVEAE